MSEMRDRIARVIADQAGFSHEGSRQYETADAVLQAMRKPTEAMLTKATTDPSLGDHRTLFQCVYSTMIDSALDPPVSVSLPLGET